MGQRTSISATRIIFPTIVLTVLILLLVSFQPDIQAAPTDTSVVYQIAETGQGPFNTTGNCPTHTPGDDCSASNQYVRTGDVIKLLWSVRMQIEPPEGDDDITLVGTVSEGLEWIRPIPAVCNASSGISADKRTLTCIIDHLDPSTTLDVFANARVKRDQRNGAVVTAGLTYSSRLTPLTVLPDVSAIVSAAPQLDLAKTFTDKLGMRLAADGVTQGIVYLYDVSIQLESAGLGNELVTGDITFTDDLSAYPAGTKLYNWKTAKCGYNTQYYLRTTIPGGIGGTSNSVSNSGVWNCTDNDGSISVVISNADLSGTHVPTTDYDGDVLPADSAYVVAGVIPIWVPLSALDIGRNVTNTLIDLEVTSISGQANYLGAGEPTDNNSLTHFISGLGSGAFNTRFQQDDNNVVPGQTEVNSGDGPIGPGQIFETQFSAINNGAIDWNNFIYCNKLDTSTYLLEDYTSGDAARWDFYDFEFPQDPAPVEGVDFVIEYGVVADQASSSCGDADSTVGWHEWTNAAAFASPDVDINAVRVRFLTPVETNWRFRVAIQNKAREGVPNGTILATYSTHQADEINLGFWAPNYFDPINFVNIGPGDRLFMTRAIARVAKSSYPEYIDIINAGDPISFIITPTVSSPLDSPPIATNVVVTDVLPALLNYKTAVPTPDRIIVRLDGTTLLVWELGDRTPNDPIPSILVHTDTSIYAPSLETAINTAIIATPEDGSPEEFRTDTHTVQTVNFTALQAFKVTPTPVIEQNSPMTYTILYRNAGQADIPQVDFIDRLPWNGDSRVPATNFHGTLALQEVITTSTVSVYYTDTPPTSIAIDPADPSNEIGSGSTVWCTAAQIDSAETGCPTSIATSTAFRVIDSQTLKIGTSLRKMHVRLVASGNWVSDRYVNNFSARANGLFLAIESNYVPIIVTESAYLDIQKTVNVDATSCVTADTILVYTITIKNIGLGTACNGTFIDDLPANTTLIPNSITIDGAPVADTSQITFPVGSTGSGCLGDVPGLPTGESMTVSFALQSTTITNTIVNQARVTGVVNPNGTPFTNVPANYLSYAPTPLDDYEWDSNASIDSGNVIGNLLDDNPTTVCVDPNYGSIGDFVWYDANADGHMNEADGDYPLVGVLMTLFDSGRAVQSVSTGSDGAYLFENLLAGEYMVIVTPPDPDLTQTFDPDAVTDGQHQVTLLQGQNYLLADFAFGPEPTAIVTSSVGATSSQNQSIIWMFVLLLAASLWFSRSKVRG